MGEVLEEWEEHVFVFMFCFLFVLFTFDLEFNGGSINKRNFL